MLEGNRILAVVPARSGSKGIPNKNLRTVGGVSLVGHAGIALSRLECIDARIISTDSSEYAEEGRRYGLDAPFLRPAELSTDEAGALETVQHSLRESENHYGIRFDIVLIIEPTSPLRRPEDVLRTTLRLLRSSADSAMTVSPLPMKFHPLKIFGLEDGKIRFYLDQGSQIVNRQQVSRKLYSRNGICYALRRECLMDKSRIITDNTLAEVIDRTVVNIDDEGDLLWAEFMMGHELRQGRTVL